MSRRQNRRRREIKASSAASTEAPERALDPERRWILELDPVLEALWALQKACLCLLGRPNLEVLTEHSHRSGGVPWLSCSTAKHPSGTAGSLRLNCFSDNYN